MPATFRLQPLLDLSHLRLDEATRKLGELIAGEQEAAQRHTLLTQYRSEYQVRFMAAAKTGIGPLEWNNYRQLLTRIDEAIIQAALSVTLTQQRTLAGRQNWLGKKGRVQAFDTLADRHHANLAYKELRTEQKASDDHGARHHDENPDD